MNYVSNGFMLLTKEQKPIYQNKVTKKIMFHKTRKSAQRKRLRIFDVVGWTTIVEAKFTVATYPVDNIDEQDKVDNFIQKNMIPKSLDFVEFFTRAETMLRENPDLINTARYGIWMNYCDDIDKFVEQSGAYYNNMRYHPAFVITNEKDLSLFHLMFGGVAYYMHITF